MAALLPWIMAGTQLYSGVTQRQSANRAAEAAQRAGEFNATLIERDIDLLEKQRAIFNANFTIQSERARQAFERDVQGAARAGFGYAGIDMSQGTPMQVLRTNAREFEYSEAVAEFDRQVTNMQISDEQENARLNAELSRMEGGAQAAGLRAQGTTSLIRGFGGAATTAWETGMFA